MTDLYITSDFIGNWTGGGTVTAQELWALNDLDDNHRESTVFVIGRDQLVGAANQGDPFSLDREAIRVIETQRLEGLTQGIRIAHFYAGTFSETIKYLRMKWPDVKITYTVAAHDRKLSIDEFHRWGVPYPFSHMSDDALFAKYCEGYGLADAIVCPSHYSADLMRSYGMKNEIVVIPHGVKTPDFVNLPLPWPKGVFRVGYLGSTGIDKGIPYLLKAWETFSQDLGYPSNCQLWLAGRDDWPMLVQTRALVASGNIFITGFVKDKTKDFFEKIHVCVQPSCTESFGIEVLESMAHGRFTLVSEGAGAHEILGHGCGYTFPIRDPVRLASLLRKVKREIEAMSDDEQDIFQRRAIGHSANFHWGLIRERYRDLWHQLLSAKAVMSTSV